MSAVESEKVVAVAIEDECNKGRGKFEAWYEQQVAALEASQIAHQAIMDQAKGRKIRLLRALIFDQLKQSNEKASFRHYSPCLNLRIKVLVLFVLVFVVSNF
jgi:hypothetical protein